MEDLEKLFICSDYHDDDGAYFDIPTGGETGMTFNTVRCLNILRTIFISDYNFLMHIYEQGLCWKFMKQN